MINELLFQKKFIEWLSDKREYRIAVLENFGLDESKSIAACPSWKAVKNYCNEAGLLEKFKRKTGFEDQGGK